MDLLQEIYDLRFEKKQLKVFVLRLDQLHPVTGGNKHFKLKYNLEKAKELNCDTLLSFGGAYSNHIAALAAEGKAQGFKTVGIIRGEELDGRSNPTLSSAMDNGMHCSFIYRSLYAQKDTPAFKAELKEKYGNFFLLPEGGSNAHAVKGCMEIKNLIGIPFDYIMTACGTGGTIAGIALSLEAHQQAIGIPVLKGAEFLERDIQELQQLYFDEYKTEGSLKAPVLLYDYHFGGYAKYPAELAAFHKNFVQYTHILLDTIYTSKAFFALYDLAGKDHFPPGKTIVILHTGGLQGNGPDYLQ